MIDSKVLSIEYWQTMLVQEYQLQAFLAQVLQPSTKLYGPIKELYHKTILQSIRKLEFMIMLSSPWQEALMELLLCRISGFEIPDSYSQTQQSLIIMFT